MWMISVQEFQSDIRTPSHARLTVDCPASLQSKSSINTREVEVGHIAKEKIAHRYRFLLELEPLLRSLISTLQDLKS